jgi:hypothetical protein
MGCRPFYSSGWATGQGCRAYLTVCGRAHQWTIFKAGHFKATKASYAFDDGRIREVWSIIDKEAIEAQPQST